MSKIVSVRDEAFNPKNAGRYELTLLSGVKSCSCSVLDPEAGKYLLLESYDVPFPGESNLIEFLSLPWKTTRIIIESNASTLVPEPLFKPEQLSSFLSVTTESTGNEPCFFNRLLIPEIYNVFSLPGEQVRLLENHFPLLPLYHISTALIDGIWMNYKNHLTSLKIFLYLEETDFYMVIFDKQQLLFLNSYHYLLPEDLIYYVIFVLEQLEINPEEVPMTLMGSITNDSPVFHLLYQYIRNLDFTEGNENYNNSEALKRLPFHIYFPLLNPIQ
ncbi:MAG: DUF3822 family protein [Bacteroidota bacterium]